ncbi:hypothetical protein KY342_05830 [Candidatus Woesearchaeota archaeon]|nr:hypothetical protein [Candidatus Woesearchaeota archaeon]
MVFVFGVDIPLVELIFVLTLVLIALFGLMIYIIIKQRQLNERLETVLDKENIELKSLKDISKEEKIEARLLRVIRTELEKLIYGEAYSKRIEALIKGKGKGRVKEREKIQKLAGAFWREIVQISKKQKVSKPQVKTKQVIYGNVSKIILKPKKKTVKKGKKKSRPKAKTKIYRNVRKIIRKAKKKR